MAAWVPRGARGRHRGPRMRRPVRAAARRAQQRGRPDERGGRARDRVRGGQVRPPGGWRSWRITWAETLARQGDPDGRQVFRSPIATLIWWVWVLFAVGNLIDLAVQGRDHLSVIAACTLLLITGVMYATALRPRIIADEDGLTIINPIRDTRVGWPAVVGFDSTELLRVRCLWTAEDGTESKTRGFYAWAAHSSRRRQVAAEMRAQRRVRGGSAARGARIGGFGSPPVD